MPLRSTRLTAAVALGALVVGSLLTGCAATEPSPSASPTQSQRAAAAPAGADGYGLPAGSGPVRIELWTDLSCPYCRMLEEASGDVISEAVASGTATLVIHPLNFVSAKHGDQTQWSTRAAGALAAALDAGNGDALPAFYALLQHNQTLADGESHPTDDDIVTYATKAGVTTDLSDAVKAQPFAAWVQASNDYWMGRTIEGTTQVVKGVPVLVIGGTVVDLEAADVAGTVKAAIEAARG